MGQVPRSDKRRRQRDVIIVLDGAHELRSQPGVSSILDDGPAVGVYAICLDEARRLMPGECRALLTCDLVALVGDTPIPGMTPVPTSMGTPQDPATGIVRAVTAAFTGADGSIVEGVRIDRVRLSEADRFARSLAPMRDTSRDDAGAGIPASLRLLDILGLEPPDPEKLLARWHRAVPPRR